MSLKGKNIIIGVTGGIAAYKIPLLVRLLKKEGANVRVIMTRSAKDFVTPLTLSAVSENPVVSEFTFEHTWNNHVEWARWADLILIAPLTANTLAKIANGQPDNFLTAVIMSAENIPVLLSPAMDREMWHYPATQKNIQALRNFGFQIIPPAQGELLSGLSGEGRMPEPEDLLEKIRKHFDQEKVLKGKKVLITGGPTYEPIDPVRFIGNRSSGKMGWALAQTAHNAGAEVILISGPSKILAENPPFTVFRVETAKQMFETFQKYFDQTDIAVLSAAVSDYTPENPQSSKIKKNQDTITLKLKKTPDILAWAGQNKKTNQIVIGFALETENEKENAQEKLKKKKADLIVLNSLNDAGAGFDTDTNHVYLIYPDNKTKEIPLNSKKEIAKEIIHEISRLV